MTNDLMHIGVKKCSSDESKFLLIFLKTNVIFCTKTILISCGGPIPHGAAAYEEFFSWGSRHHCPMEVGAPTWRGELMGSTENAGFNAKVQRNLGLDFAIKQRNHCENFNQFTAYCK